MNPYGIAPFNADLVEISRWNAANERARAEYEAHPIAFAASGLCDRRHCDNKSDRHRFCWTHRNQIRPIRRAAA